MSRVLIAHGAQYLRRERINGVVPRPPRRTTNRKAGTFRGLRARARRDMGFWVGLRGGIFCLTHNTRGVYEVVVVVGVFVTLAEWLGGG